MHFLLKCINATTAFKLRIENGEVVEYDKINISPTIGREDGTFGFGFLSMTQIFLYLLKCRKEIHRVKTVPDFLFQGHSKSGCHPLFGSALVCLFRDETCRFNSNRRFYTQISIGKLIQEKRNFCSLYPSVSTMAWWMDEMLPNLYRT